MLIYSHVVERHRLPYGKEWRHLAVYGLLNITIYLGCYVIAMQHVTAGIGALAIATNPVFISFISVLFFGKKLKASVLIAMLVCSTGVVCASWPLFKEAVVTTEGLAILFFSMLSYSVGAIYFAAKDWRELHLFTVNGWQTFIGGLLLLPVAVYKYQDNLNH